MSEANTPPLPLAGLKVIDAASLFAGPVLGTLLGDFGADVIKVEHPRGDNLRSLGWHKDGESLWWEAMARNKRSVTLKLSDPAGAEILGKLVADADVLIENFRPGTLAKWGLTWEALHEINPRLIVARMTGFGQSGPYSGRPGFGTLAESMSGYAHINGYPDGPPTLPPFALGDGVAAITGAMAVMIALWWRDANGGEGQEIDLSIYEPLFWILGPQATVYQQLGVVQERTGNRAPFTAPRNAYRAKDGKWLGLSGSAQSIAERVLKLVGRPDLVDEPWFANHNGRLAHVDELDEAIGAWIAERDSDEVIRQFEIAEGAIAPVLSIVEIVKDPQYIARETITQIDHPKLGPLDVQNMIARLVATPGSIRRNAPLLGEHTMEILGGELGIGDDEIADLISRGIVGAPGKDVEPLSDSLD